MFSVVQVLVLQHAATGNRVSCMWPEGAAVSAHRECHNALQASCCSYSKILCPEVLSISRFSFSSGLGMLSTSDHRSAYISSM